MTPHKKDYKKPFFISERLNILFGFTPLFTVPGLIHKANVDLMPGYSLNARN